MTTVLTAADRIHDEAGRMYAVTRLDILDTPPEPLFDNIVKLVERHLNAPMCTITVVDRDRLWFKAKRGVDAPEIPRESGFCHWAIREPENLVVENALEDARFRDSPAVAGAAGVRAYAGAPLTMVDGYRVGTLAIMDTKPRRFTPDELSSLRLFAAVIEDALAHRHVATHDELTGAFSRGAWRALAEEEFARLGRHGGVLSVALIDLDRFKEVNDAHGHAAGDRVLKDFAEAITGSSRRTDQFGRLGGDEFALLMTNTDLDEAATLAERLRVIAGNAAIPIGGGENLHVGLSIGCASSAPGDRLIDDILERADRALYAAKDAGRGQVKTAV